MTIIGHSDLNGAGKGGEGLALKQYSDGRRVLFLAHESPPMCVSIIDVTKPEDPKVIKQIPIDGPNLRCNSLGFAGDTPWEDSVATRGNIGSRHRTYGVTPLRSSGVSANVRILTTDSTEGQPCPHYS